jgi:hypothetical protein
MSDIIKYNKCTGGIFSFGHSYIDYEKHIIEKLRSERKQKLEKLNKLYDFK